MLTGARPFFFRLTFGLPMSESPARLPRAVLWDLDGTLADSRDQHWRAWRDAMAAAGRTLTAEQFAATFGQRNDRFLRSWLGDDQSEEQLARFGDEKEARYRSLIEAEGLEPLPGAASWVRRLNAQAGVRPSRPPPRGRISQAMLRVIGLADLLDVFVGAEDVTNGKPDPEIFLAAAARLARRAIPLHRRRGRGGRDRGCEARRHGARSAWALVPASLRMLSCRRWPI